MTTLGELARHCSTVVLYIEDDLEIDKLVYSICQSFLTE